MEKLRQRIVKMSNKEPNIPLSETQNTILQKHLTSFLFELRTTPVHPPYNWLIEKTFQGLDEEGGSTEDLISEFIKKEHHSLPRAHLTMLKYHLQIMTTEKGEILRDDGGRFLLPGDRKNSKEKKDDPQDEVRTKERKDKRRGKAHKSKEDVDDPDSILLKDFKLSTKLTKK